MTHICVGKLTIIGSDNGLSPARRQAIIRTNAGLLLIRPLGTNFSEILIAILTFSFKKMRLIVSSAKRRTYCLGLNVLMCKEINYLFCVDRSYDWIYILLEKYVKKNITDIKKWTRRTIGCISKLNSIGSDNGLSPGRSQTIIWIKAGILLIWPLGTSISEILIEIHTLSFKKMHLKISSGNGNHLVLASMC